MFTTKELCEQGINYLYIENGKLTAKILGELCVMDSVYGIIDGMHIESGVLNGRKVDCMYIDIADTDRDEIYKLEMLFGSVESIHILNCLASAKDLKKNKVEIHPYMQDGNTNIIVKEAGEKLDWKMNVSSENLCLIADQLYEEVRTMVWKELNY